MKKIIWKYGENYVEIYGNLVYIGYQNGHLQSTYHAHNFLEDKYKREMIKRIGATKYNRIRAYFMKNEVSVHE